MVEAAGQLLSYVADVVAALGVAQSTALTGMLN